MDEATFMPLVFSTTGGMAVECKRYQGRLAVLVATENGESYATSILWIRAWSDMGVFSPSYFTEQIRKLG